MSPTVQTTLVIFLAFVATARGFNQIVLKLTNETTTCTRNMACKYAVCAWQRNPRVTPQSCMFLGNSCRCPVNTICAITNHVTPGSMYLTYKYKCRNPVNLFAAVALKTRQSRVDMD